MVKMSYYTDMHDYTDGHDVDEDQATITHHGGSWYDGIAVGVAVRNVSTGPTFTTNNVASRCCTIQKKINITHPH